MFAFEDAELRLAKAHTDEFVLEAAPHYRVARTAKRGLSSDREPQGRRHYAHATAIPAQASKKYAGLFICNYFAGAGSAFAKSPA